MVAYAHYPCGNHFILEGGVAIKNIRSHLKKTFWPDIGVELSFKALGIREYACGLKLGLALIWNQNPFFKMASILGNRSLPG